MFEQKINAILTAIRARAAAYTAAADAIETAAREAETARIQAGDRIAAAVASVVNPSDYGDSIGHDALFTGVLETAVEALGTAVVDAPTVPEKPPEAPKTARKRGKSKTTDETPDESYIAARTNRALVVSYGKGVRIVSDDGSVYDLTGTVEEFAATLESNGLTVYRSYDAWDARPVA